MALHTDALGGKSRWHSFTLKAWSPAGLPRLSEHGEREGEAPCGFADGGGDATDRGYQFEFFCDRCSNGLVSELEASAVGLASGVLKAAGDILGGIFGQASRGSYEVGLNSILLG